MGSFFPFSIIEWALPTILFTLTPINQDDPDGIILSNLKLLCPFLNNFYFNAILFPYSTHLPATFHGTCKAE